MFLFVQLSELVDEFAKWRKKCHLFHSFSLRSVYAFLLAIRNIPITRKPCFKYKQMYSCFIRAFANKLDSYNCICAMSIVIGNKQICATSFFATKAPLICAMSSVNLVNHSVNVIFIHIQLFLFTIFLLWIARGCILLISIVSKSILPYVSLVHHARSTWNTNKL